MTSQPVIDIDIHMQPWETMKPDVLARMRAGHPDFEDLVALSRGPQAFLRRLDDAGIPPARVLEWFPRLEAIASKSIFGTDWPGPGVPAPERNIAAFKALPLSAGSLRAILYDNARRLWDRLPAPPPGGRP